MTKQELKRDLIAANGGRPMMSKRRIRMIIGIGEDTMNEMLASTDYGWASGDPGEQTAAGVGRRVYDRGESDRRAHR